MNALSTIRGQADSGYANASDTRALLNRVALAEVIIKQILDGQHSLEELKQVAVGYCDLFPSRTF